MAEKPNLAGIATQDLVETIGGSFKAPYINWARTMNLLHLHGPGWSIEMQSSQDGNHTFKAPDGTGYLMLRLVHLDGTVTPYSPQAIMDTRNNPVPFDKIHSRHVTDTHRRGSCMVCAFETGLAYELWAKMPLESGYGDHEIEAIDQKPQTVTKAVQATVTEVTMQDFLDAAAAKGLNSEAVQMLLTKVGANFAGAVKSLETKDEAWVLEQNNASQPSKTVKPAAKKVSTKPSPDEY